ncbi:MAG: hypothetical protein H6735_27490 [Alphaproteobacteria bacterium]|nr:hypothetical protein [Alphaproteobacteria bacterium]
MRRIVVVDDEYASDTISIEELIGICEALPPETAVTIPSLGELPFDADPDVWRASLQNLWAELDGGKQADLLRRARIVREDNGAESTFLSDDDDEPHADPSDGDSSQKVSPVVGTVGEAGEGEPQPDLDPTSEPAAATGEQQPSDPKRDAVAALGLQQLLADLPDFTFETLSLGQWNESRDRYLGDEDEARHTLFLFDRDFRREHASSDEGLKLVREVQKQGASLCGLITHTVPVGAEHEAWDSLARDHDLDRDRFLVIAKQRLSVDNGATHYSFLRMVRLAALSSRCGAMKNAAWRVFADSVEAAKEAMERVSVLDFDQIVLASSRREGVWEPDTLFRIFSVFMRREARRRMHENLEADLPSKVRDARSVSVIPGDDEAVYGSEPPCAEAIRVHRFELFESPEYINRHHLPIDLGDLFQDARGTQFILLSQPCDLMVRSNGRRSYDDKCTRQVVLAEIVRPAGQSGPKDSWEKIDWYDEATGQPAYVDFANAHDVRLAVLDLCVLNEDGKASIDVDVAGSSGLIEPWQKHCEKVRRLFRAAIERYKELEKKQVKNEIKKALLPAASLSARFDAGVDGSVLTYEIRRVGRLLQPRAGAVLTHFAQYRSRAAFEHDLDHRTPRTNSDDENQRSGSDCSGDSGSTANEGNGDG